MCPEAILNSGAVPGAAPGSPRVPGTHGLGLALMFFFLLYIGLHVDVISFPLLAQAYLFSGPQLNMVSVSWVKSHRLVVTVGVL